MTISVRRVEDGSYEVINGIARMRAGLESGGVVEVVELGTNNKLHVHLVDGQLLALSAGAQAALEAEVQAAMRRMRG